MGLTPKQLAVFKYIEEHFQREGLAPSQKEIKERFALKSYGSVQRYLKYLQEEGLISKEWNARRGIRPQSEGQINSRPNSMDQSFVSIPFLGQVAAGALTLAQEDHDQTPLLLPKEQVGKWSNLFALKVKGDSMIEAGIHSGDLAICEPSSKANRGQIVVALLGDEASLKYYYPHDQGIELRPANVLYSPIQIEKNKAEDFRLLGRLVMLIRSYS